MNRSTPAKSAAFKHSKRVAWRKVADEAVILDVETAAYFSLDGVGLRVWELLESGSSLDRIVSSLSGEYDAPADVIRRDCEELLERLRKHKIVEPA